MGLQQCKTAVREESGLHSQLHVCNFPGDTAVIEEVERGELLLDGGGYYITSQNYSNAKSAPPLFLLLGSHWRTLVPFIFSLAPTLLFPLLLSWFIFLFLHLHTHTLYNLMLQIEASQIGNIHRSLAMFVLYFLRLWHIPTFFWSSLTPPFTKVLFCGDKAFCWSHSKGLIWTQAMQYVNFSFHLHSTVTRFPLPRNNL